MTSRSRTHQDFHVGLKALIEDKGKLLVLQDEEGLWELPGGRIERREVTKSLKEILMREIQEELGTKIQIEVGPVIHSWIRDSLYDKEYFIFLVGFRCTFIQGNVKLSEEHKDFKWITEDDIDSLEFENTYKSAIKQYFQSRGSSVVEQ